MSNPDNKNWEYTRKTKVSIRKDVKQMYWRSNRPTWFIVVVLSIVFGLSACAGNNLEGAQSESINTATAATQDEKKSVDEPQQITITTKLNLNTATRDELLNTIPNFGDRMAREFFEYRPYISIQQFRREIGKYVDDAQVAEYEKYVYVPVNVNESDAETLKQLPGIDDAMAKALLTARPYASNAAFLEKLAEYASVETLAVAENYLEAE